MGDKKVTTKKYEAGEIIVQRSMEADKAGLVVQGCVYAQSGSVCIELKPGSIIGLADFGSGMFVFDYTAGDDTVIAWSPCRKIEDTIVFFGQEEKCQLRIAQGAMQLYGQLADCYETLQQLNGSIIEEVRKYYADYIELCEKIECEPYRSLSLDNLAPLQWNVGSVRDTMEYLREFDALEDSIKRAFFAGGERLILHYLKDVSKVVRPLVQACEMQLTGVEDALDSLCNDGADNVFQLYMELLKNSKTSPNSIRDLLQSMKHFVQIYMDTEETLTDRFMLEIESKAGHFQTVLDNIAGFYQNSMQLSVAEAVSMAVETDEMDDVHQMMEKLLDYAQMEPDMSRAFQNALQQYKNLPDRSSTDDQARKIRKVLTQLFYKLYEEVFFKAEEQQRDNKILRLFLNYGIVDEQMFGEEELSKLADYEAGSLELPIHVYTIREWLHAVYTGERQPSRNEFDQNYEDYIREQYKGRENISAKDMEELMQPRMKVQFEIKNFFLMNNRLTSGHLLTFCPVLMPEDISGLDDKDLLHAQQINDAVGRVQKIDFSIFYRDVMYDDRKNGIHNLIIHRECLPEVILMPNVGTMGRMWQEISGKKRASSARFTLPFILREELDKVVVRMLGNFRWEICKRVQGNYWNDATEPSLTAEFCDYLQFYKKNRDLSDKAKDKIGQWMTKFRNNYGDVFTENYKLWIQSEALGNVRLDKVSRNILGRYCPFAKEQREPLLEHPMFREALGRYERERKKHLKELNNRRAAIRNCNGAEPEEFLHEFEVYEM